MIRKNSRVRHTNPEINEKMGIMSVFEIKNGFAVCAKGGFENYGAGMNTYPITELTLVP